MDKGLKILFNTYWCSAGWKNGEVTKEDFEIAKSQGYMFDYPEYKTHDEVISNIKEVVNKIDRYDVANAFLYSLSTRRLEYRSALGSYYYAKSIPLHNENFSLYGCNICGFNEFEIFPTTYDFNYGLNVFNFERYKWGGVRHSYPEYVLFDLEQFLKLPKVESSKEDVLIFGAILNLAKDLDPKRKISAYSKLITSKKLFKSNKYEIDVILNILGMCDVFNSKEHSGYLSGFKNTCNRIINNEYDYPVNMWHAYDGINYDAIRQVFDILI